MYPGPTAGQVAARAAGDRLVPRITSLKDGDQVDLAEALGVGWQRGVLMEAYLTGDEMNEVVGFDWYREQEWSGSDESQRTLAFVSGRNVVAEVLLSPETFRVDEAIEAFDVADAPFVGHRQNGVVWLYRP